MATDTVDENSRSVPARGPAVRVHVFVAAVAARVLRAMRQRTARPRLAYLGVPLAIVASALAVPVLAPLLIPCAWWWSPHDWGYEWIAVVGRGLLGVEWSLIGVNLIAAYPAAPALAGIVWACVALFIALLSYLTRRPAAPWT